jgi:hypothetical protein
MSSHPNAILQLTLQPQDLPRKTMRAILQDAGVDPDEESPSIGLEEGGFDYHVRLMEGSYDEDFQIGAPEGTIVLDSFLTYGYGDKLEWGKVAAKYERLKAWADAVCEKHHCTIHEIAVTANYW